MIPACDGSTEMHTAMKQLYSSEQRMRCEISDKSDTIQAQFSHGQCPIPRLAWFTEPLPDNKPTFQDPLSTIMPKLPTKISRLPKVPEPDLPTHLNPGGGHLVAIVYTCVNKAL